MIKRNDSLRDEKGQALLEILLAFSVASVVLGAIVFGIATSLNNTLYTKNQGLAISYAQEGMTVIRKIRDSSWSNFCTYGNNNYCLPQNLTTSSPELIPYDSNNCFQNGIVGNFVRKAVITHSSQECCSHDNTVTTPCPPSGTCMSGTLGSKVTVSVAWTDSKCQVGAPYCHNVEVATCLSNTSVSSFDGFAQDLTPTSTPVPTSTPIPIPGLVGQWKMDGNVKDSTTNGNDGNPCGVGATNNGNGTCTATFYPDSGSGGVDGIARYNPGGDNDWHALVIGSGNQDYPSQTSSNLYEAATATTSKWATIHRLYFYFDTSALPDNTTISAATISFRGSAKLDSLGAAPTFNVYGSNSTHTTSSDVTEYEHAQSTAFSTAMTYAGFSTSGYNDFALNASGIAAVSKTSYSRFTLRFTNDVSDTAPSWVNAGNSYFTIYMTEQGAGYKPKLVVTYSSFTTDRNGQPDSAYSFNGTTDHIVVPGLQSGLSGYWNFNGNAYDTSGNGNNGTVNGATLTPDRQSQADKAYSFNGTSNNITTSNNTNLINSDYSIFAWIKPSGLATAYNLIYYQTGWDVSLGVDGTSKKLENWTNNANEINGNTTIPLNTWSFVGIVSNASGKTFYLNGASDGIGAAVNVATTHSSTIGGYSSSSYFSGVIDDVRVYSRALSATEIAALYQSYDLGWMNNVGSSIKTVSFWMQANTTASKKIFNINGTRQIETNGSSNIVATSFPAATVYVDGSSSSANIPDTNWHFVTITDSSGVSASTFDIGAVSTSYFNGKLDDVRVYNRALSQAEISSIYNDGPQ
jgi:hypothetical protein